MKAAVGGMGVLIVVGTAVVVGTIIHRLYARDSAPPPIAQPLAAEVPAHGFTSIYNAPGGVDGAKPAMLAPGEHISGIAAAGAYVAIWVSGPTGARVLLLDPASGQVRVGLTEAAN